MKTAKCGVRRQSEAATALWILKGFKARQSKAGSRYACRRTPNLFFSSLLEQLLLRESAIEQIHLFGSRGYGTGATRSDCDLLIEFDQTRNLKSSDLRDFATANCAALDFFLVTGGRATSCSNDSFVFAHSADELKSRLDAKLLWNKETGFSASPMQPAPAGAPPPSSYLVRHGRPHSKAA